MPLSPWLVKGMGELEKIVAENVRRLRKERSLTQEALAHEVGITTRYCGMVERAETSVTVGVLERLATALRVAPRELLQEGN